jgi:hypothetical protein
VKPSLVGDISAQTSCCHVVCCKRIHVLPVQRLLRIQPLFLDSGNDGVSCHGVQKSSHPDLDRGASEDLRYVALIAAATGAHFSQHQPIHVNKVWHENGENTGKLGSGLVLPH